MCFGSVYAWNTSSRGASKTRVSVSVRPRISVVVAVPPRPSRAASLSRLWPSPSLVGPLIASRSSTVSKRCVMVSFVLAPCASNTTAMSTSGGMRLKLAEVAVEAVEALLPEAPIALDPVGDLPQALGLEPAGPPLRVAAPRDQAGVLEHLEVLRDRGKAHGEGLRELGDGRLAGGQTGEDRPPRGIGDRGERRAQRVGRHPYCTFRLNNWMV